MVFVWKKYGLNEINDIKFIQNKMERRESKYKKGNDKGSSMVK